MSLLECADAAANPDLMSTTGTITHAQLGDVLANLRLGVSASDLHGSLTGYLCGGGAAGAQGWLAALELHDAATTDLSHAALLRLHAECAAWLDDPELRFEPLLPTEDHALDVRADALVEWCRGFLGGLGLTGAASRGGLSPDAEEILRDLGAIAGASFEYADTEEDENALAEVVEFIRVGVLLLHAELTTAHDPRGRATVH